MNDLLILSFLENDNEALHALSTNAHSYDYVIIVLTEKPFGAPSLIQQLFSTISFTVILLSIAEHVINMILIHP